MLKHYDELGLIGLVIYIDGELKGFTAGERISRKLRRRDQGRLCRREN